MLINMDETRLRTIEQVEDFLRDSTSIESSAVGEDTQRYAQSSRVLKRFDYPGRTKKGRGILRRDLQQTRGCSRAQRTRLVSRWRGNRLAAIPLVKRDRAPAAPFARKSTTAEIALRVEMDKAHEDVCGPAIVHLLRRAYREYGDARDERLATLCLAPVQPAQERWLAGAAVGTTPTRARCATRSGCARRQLPMVVRAWCASIRSIKANMTASRACSTSRASTR